MSESAATARALYTQFIGLRNSFDDTLASDVWNPQLHDSSSLLNMSVSIFFPTCFRQVLTRCSLCFAGNRVVIRLRLPMSQIMMP